MFEYFFRRRQDHSGSALPDLDHVMKASQSIMGEIVLERLLPKLMQMMLEMSEATKGAIILAQETGLKIVVIGTSKPTIQVSLLSISVKTSSLLPVSLIDRVAQTQETILLSSAAQQGNFTTDPYIKQNQLKTVLCVPLLGKSHKLIGTIYLENNLLANAFKPQQINILKLIPAGLCIENAQLYQQLEIYSNALEDKIQELRHSQQVSRGQTAVLTNTLNVLIKEPKLDKLLETVLNSISKELNAVSSVVWLYDAEQDIISHYMSHQKDSTFGSSPPFPPSLIYHQVSKHPFWKTIITRTNYTYLSVDREQIFDPNCYQWLVEQNLKSLIILPLVLGSKLLGLLSIQRMVEEPFPDEQIELAMALAKQTSLAMQLTNLAAKNRSAAILAERNRLAREIHDTLAQTFTGISMQVGVAQRIIDRDPAEAKNLIKRIGELAKDGLAEARRSVWALCPETLECNSLPEALSKLVAKMTVNTNVKAEINIQGTPIPLNSEISLNLLRIGQEALTNSLKHSQAQNIWLDLIFKSDRVQLRLKDNGQGFNSQLTNDKGGFGLIGMRQRAEQLSSELKIVSQLEKGTEISVEVVLGDH